MFDGGIVDVGGGDGKGMRNCVWWSGLGKDGGR